MSRSTSRHSVPCCKRRNLAALIVAGGAVTFLYLDCDPTPAGTRSQADLLAEELTPPPPPMPIPAGANSESGALQVSQEHISGHWAMMLNVMMLERGCESFGRIDNYTAMLHKQERIGGELGDVQKVECKLRHEPFSIYMKWHSGDVGRELIFVDGANDGNMVVHPGGWKGRLTGALNLDPNGSMAMAESRHPVTQAGLKRLAETLLSYHRKCLQLSSGWTCDLFDNQKINGRDCYLVVVTYASQQRSETYRKSMHYIDKELSLPICTRNFGWPEDECDAADLDEQTLIESYTWTDIQVESRLADADFDSTNSDYNFRRR
jgi:hypothetical protein